MVLFWVAGLSFDERLIVIRVGVWGWELRSLVSPYSSYLPGVVVAVNRGLAGEKEAVFEEVKVEARQTSVERRARIGTGEWDRLARVCGDADNVVGEGWACCALQVSRRLTVLTRILDEYRSELWPPLVMIDDCVLVLGLNGCRRCVVGRGVEGVL